MSRGAGDLLPRDYLKKADESKLLPGSRRLGAFIPRTAPVVWHNWDNLARPWTGAADPQVSSAVREEGLRTAGAGSPHGFI
jgi:hypothetical protein